MIFYPHMIGGMILSGPKIKGLTAHSCSGSRNNGHRSLP